MMNPGFRNSDGCTEAKPKENQRTAPLPKSVPKAGSNARAMKVSRKPTTPSRRTISGVIIDTAIIAAMATPPKNA